MKLDYLYLVGGPLDGMYMPANPKHDGVPSKIAIYAAECGWHAYLNPNDGGTLKIDVYKIMWKSDNSFTRKPSNVQVYELHYDSALSPMQAQQIERLVRRHGT